MRYLYISILLFLTLLLYGCTKKIAEPEIVITHISIENTNGMPFGVKVWFSHSSGVPFTYKVIHGKEQKEITGISGTPPSDLLDSIGIYDTLYSVKYRNIVKPVPTAEENKLLYKIKMPPRKSGVLVLRNNGVSFIRSGSLWIGFTTTDQIFGYQSFYHSDENFNNIILEFLPALSDGWVIDAVNGSEIYAHDSDPYSGYVRMMISTDMGSDWKLVVNVQTELFGFGTSNLGGYFLDDSHQWYFLYEDWARTRIFTVVNDSSSQAALLEGYCAHRYKFLDSNIGFILANTNDNVTPSTASDTYILRTTDGGKTWGTPVLISATESPVNLWVFNSDSLIVTARPYSGGIKYFYRSVDGGHMWSKINIPVDDFVSSLTFINASTGFLKTGTNIAWSQFNKGFVYKTVDGGDTWSKVGNAEQYGSSIYFYDELHGQMQDLIYGKGQILLTTSDGGVSWEELLYPYDYISE